MRALDEFLSRRQVMAYLVGGFVRDACLGRATRDVDLAVKGDALSLAKELADAIGGTFVLLNEAHTTARVVLPSEPGEGKRGIPRKQVDLTSFEGDIIQDMARRDFTIDALALSLDDALGEAPQDRLVDPFNGLADLVSTTIRAVSDHSFRDDPARLMRAVRLAAQLGFSLAPDTHQLVRRDSPLLTTVAPERLRDELLKTLAESNASHYVQLMDDLGLLCSLIPELEAARGVAQPKEHYWDVLHHCLETPSQVERVTTEKGRAGDNTISHAPWHLSLEAYFDEEVSDGHTRRTLVKLAGLLHDVSKPATRTIEPTGRVRFFGHDTQGAEVSEDVLRRLRLSSRGINLISTMVRHHLRPTQMSQGVEMPTPRAIYRYYRDLEEAAIDTLYLNMADYLAAKGPSIEVDDWQRHCRLIGHILHQGLDQSGAPQKTPRLVDGHLLMKALGLAQGPLVGRLLEAIQEAYGAGEISTREDALEMARRLVAEN
ncbi:MAG: HD domain-containing protein [Chloroflexi bacterium]|nr:HD domain-containing protein [Chloroflexota bacterium]